MIEDPRVNRQKKHQLQDIFFITLCAVISGADNWVMIEEFGRSKEAWFKEQLDLQHGIPSHDTFGDVFAVIDTEAFSACFSRWVADLANLTSGEIIAIDGKTVRRSLDKASGKAAIHRVSVWAQQNSLVLGQVKVDDKSNEITAIPKLLKKLDITGTVVTIDAMGCQTAIAKQIIEQKGDYVLSLKGNQGTLHDDVETWFTSALAPDCSSVDIDAGHGRIEIRSVQVSDDIQWLRERDDPVRLGYAVRAHWSVENNLHWVLDVAFDEDRNRTRIGNSAANLAIVRHVALNLIKNESSSKVGVKTKRAKAGWSNKYLLKILGII